MKFYNMTFFCDKESKLKAHASEDKNNIWPITLKINSSDVHYDAPNITIFCNRNQLFMLADTLNTAIKDLIDPVQNYLDGVPASDPIAEKESLLDQKYDDDYHSKKDEGEL